MWDYAFWVRRNVKSGPETETRRETEETSVTQQRNNDLKRYVHKFYVLLGLFGFWKSFFCFIQSIKEHLEQVLAMTLNNQ